MSKKDVDSLIKLSGVVADLAMLQLAEELPQLFNAIIENDTYNIEKEVNKHKYSVKRIISEWVCYRDCNPFQRKCIDYLMQLKEQGKINTDDSDIIQSINKKDWATLYINHIEHISNILKQQDLNLSIRISTESDREIITELLSSRYGNWITDYEGGDIQKLNNRFYMLFDGENLVAVTGFLKNQRFNGYEIDWACVNKKYEHKGLMIKLMRFMLDEYKEEKNIYCACWKTEDYEKIHLYSSMRALGFKPVQEPLQTFRVGHSCDERTYKNCAYYTGNNCRCSLDLYMLDIKEYRNEQNK